MDIFFVSSYCIRPILPTRQEIVDLVGLAFVTRQSRRHFSYHCSLHILKLHSTLHTPHSTTHRKHPSTAIAMDYIVREASLDPDEEEEYDEELGEVKPKPKKASRHNDFDDSSEEESDDDDEEAARIREGFIVEDDEEDEELEDGTMVKVKRRRKRRRSHRDEDEDEVLDEEDLALMLENTGEGSRDNKVCMHRLPQSRGSRARSRQQHLH